MVGLLQVSLGEAVILLGLGALLVDRILEIMGKSRSARVLRQENTDLIRRNSDLEIQQARMTVEMDRLHRNISDLETALETLDALQKRRRQT